MLLNAVLFQAGWWACVLAAANHRAALALLALAGVVAIQVLLYPAPARMLRLALLCLGLGAVIESAFVALRVTAFPHDQILLGLAPAWMAGMWALLATSLDASLRWLQQRALLGSAFGAAAGPLSYAAGARLGALALPGPRSPWVIAAVWAVAFPLLLRLARPPAAAPVIA